MRKAAKASSVSALALAALLGMASGSAASDVAVQRCFDVSNKCGAKCIREYDGCHPAEGSTDKKECLATAEKCQDDCKSQLNECRAKAEKE